MAVGSGYTTTNDRSVGEFITRDIYIDEIVGNISYMRGEQLGQTEIVLESDVHIRASGAAGTPAAAPSDQLAVFGNAPGVYMSEEDSVDKNALLYMSSGTLTLRSVDDDGSFSTDPVKIDMGSPTNAIVMDSSGQVGIGTDSPSAKLDIDGGGIIGTTYFAESTTGDRRWAKVASITIPTSYDNAHLEIIINERTAFATLTAHVRTGNTYDNIVTEDFTLHQHVTGDFASAISSSDIKIGRKDTGSQTVWDIWFQGSGFSKFSFSVPRVHYYGDASVQYYTDVYSGSGGLDDPTATGYDTSYNPIDTWFNSGDVGIGTDSPQRPLHVIGPDGAGSLPSFSLPHSTALLQNNNSTSDDAVLTLVAGTAGESAIIAADANAEDVGGIRYNHNLNQMMLDGGTEKIKLISDEIRLEVSAWAEDLDFTDAGSAGATEQDWIEVRVGSTIGYIRVFASK